MNNHHNLLRKIPFVFDKKDNNSLLNHYLLIQSLKSLYRLILKI